MVGLEAVFVGKVKVGNQAPRDAGKRILIGEGLHQIAQIVTGALLDRGAPDIDQGARRLGRRGAGQPLAQDEADGLRQGRIVAVGHLGKARVVAKSCQRGAEVVRHALHAHCPQGFDAGQ